jgi:hypothetical protein
MKIKDLFSKLESETSEVFGKIRTAVTNSLDFVDIREKDIHIHFKFMSAFPLDGLSSTEMKLEVLITRTISCFKVYLKVLMLRPYSCN